MQSQSRLTASALREMLGKSVIFQVKVVLSTKIIVLELESEHRVSQP